METKAKKNIGGPGYIGSFIVVYFKNGDTKFIETEDITHEDCAYFAEEYENVKMVSGFEKTEPFQSEIEVTRYECK